MCSIVGYIGNKSSRLFVLEGLARLEYREYDSAGFVCFDSTTNTLAYTKSHGHLTRLQENLDSMPLDGLIGVGETCRTPEGAQNKENIHPHFDCNKSIAVAHNGIISNNAALRASLSRSHHVQSQTNAEIIAHLLEEALAHNSTPTEALLSVVQRLEGVFAFCALLKKSPEYLLLARKHAALYIGYGTEQLFVASDSTAFSGWTRHILTLPDESIAIASLSDVSVLTFQGKPLEVQQEIMHAPPAHCESEISTLRTIYNTKRAIQQTAVLCKEYQELESIEWQLGIDPHAIQHLRSIHLVGSGTSYYAALLGRFFFEKIAMTPTMVHLASEFRHQPLFPEPRSISLALSQSGTSLDTLESIRFLNAHNVHTIAMTYDHSCDMVAESRGYLLTGVRSDRGRRFSRTFAAQITMLYWFAHWIAFKQRMITRRHVDDALTQVLIATELLESVVEKYKQTIIHHSAPFFAKHKHLIFLGRHISYPFACEAALKLKESAYIFVDCLPAGELQHAHLSLIDNHIPVVLFSCLDPIVYKKLVLNAEEVKARSGHLVVFAFENQQELIGLADTVFIHPVVEPLLAPFVMTGLMELFVSEIACALRHPIEKSTKATYQAIAD